MTASIDITQQQPGEASAFAEAGRYARYARVNFYDANRRICVSCYAHRLDAHELAAAEPRLRDLGGRVG